MAAVVGATTACTLERFKDVWTIGQMIGKGMFGQIYEVRDRASERVEAVKVLGLKDRALRQAARAEVKVWAKIGQHKNIVTLHDIFEEKDTLYMVMEKCDGHIMSRLANGFRMKEIPALFQQMLLSLAHLHSINVVHRDIKLENFLCVGNGLKLVKLCDFGFAEVLPKSGELSGVFGTPPYMSPEMLGKRHSTKTDIWSMGVLCHFILSGGRFPYEPNEKSSPAMKTAISEGPQLRDFQAPLNVTAEAKQFTICLLDRNESSRLTAQEALQHTFLWKGAPREGSPTPSEQSTIASEKELVGHVARDISPTPSEWGDGHAPWSKILAKGSNARPTMASGGSFGRSPASTLLFDL